MKKFNTRLSFPWRAVNSLALIISKSMSTYILCNIQPSKKKTVVVRDRSQPYWCIMVSLGTAPSPMPVLNSVAQSSPRHRENNAIQGWESNVASEGCHRFPEVWVYQCCWHPQVSIWMCLCLFFYFKLLFPPLGQLPHWRQNIAQHLIYVWEERGTVLEKRAQWKK